MGVKVLAEDDYYSLDKLLSYHATWNFIIGARGLGKTFEAKRKCIRDFIKHGYEFIYLRRTDVEQKSKGTFFTDIAPFFPDFEFRVNGFVGQMKRRKEGKKDWKICCYFLALSQAGGKKSVAYPKVHTIIYDEVFPDNMQFLSGEMTLFLGFYSTVERWHDRAQSRVLFLSNAVSQANPYFAHYHLDLTRQQQKHDEIATYCDNFIAVQLADYAGFSAKVAESEFGRFLLKYDPDFADYAMYNKFLDDSEKLTGDMPEDVGYSYTLDTPYGEFGIWMSFSDEYTTKTVWVSRRVKRKDPHRYTLDYTHVDDDTIYLKRSDQIIQGLLYCYRVGQMRFDTRQCKSDFTMVLGDLMGK